MRYVLYVVLSFHLKVFSQTTFCNPINIDYGYTPFERFSKHGKHRATADPVIVNFRDTLYLFSTNQEGYWWSADMLNWNFIHRKFLRDNKYVHDLNAPAAWKMGDTLYVYGSTWEKDFPIWKSTNPSKNKWNIAKDTLQVGAWDPAFFFDEETKKLYLYWGSSNKFPLMGIELDAHSFDPIGEPRELLQLFPEKHGWERFGEYNDNVFLPPFIEGAWMNKYNGKYYLQYSAPGTEFSGYADGVYVSNHTLEGFEYQLHNPFSYKPGGFSRGAGHGSTFQDKFQNWWHVSTQVISVKNNFERRIGIWPAGFDADGVLYCNTAYGDYPTYLPNFAKNKDFKKGLFTGWMLLNYQKPVQVSSTYGGNAPNFAVDEDIKTFWSAATGKRGEWILSDLGDICTIHAYQINYADVDADFMGKSLNKRHRYKTYYSSDGKKWKILVDKSKNNADIPHEYVELKQPIRARYVKLENIEMPTGKFALSGFRIFGRGNGNPPTKVEDFIALRADKNSPADRKKVWLKWKLHPQADGYVIYFGKSPDKLYNSIMVYGKNEYFFTGADEDDTYYFQIEAFNSNGISELSPIVVCK